MLKPLPRSTCRLPPAFLARFRAHLKLVKSVVNTSNLPTSAVPEAVNSDPRIHGNILSSTLGS